VVLWGKIRDKEKERGEEQRGKEKERGELNGERGRMKG